MVKHIYGGNHSFLILHDLSTRCRNAAARTGNVRRSIKLFSHIPAVGAQFRSAPRIRRGKIWRVQLSPFPILPLGRRLRIPQPKPGLLSDDYRLSEEIVLRTLLSRVSLISCRRDIRVALMSPVLPFSLLEAAAFGGGPLRRRAELDDQRLVRGLPQYSATALAKSSSTAANWPLGGGGQRSPRTQTVWQRFRTPATDPKSF